MEVNRIDARPLIFLNNEDFDCLSNDIKNVQIVSDFFKQERLKIGEGLTSTGNFIRYKLTPFSVAVIAIAYPFYEISPQTTAANVACFAMYIFGLFAYAGLQDLRHSFAGEELRVTNLFAELCFKNYFKNKNLPEKDFELLLALMKKCCPSGEHEVIPLFSIIKKELEKIESEATFLFKIPFAEDTDLGQQLPFEVWEHIAEKASAIHLQS